jgi:NTP pyrophosphatase (non-canonical NTP hydrolase)
MKQTKWQHGDSERQDDEIRAEMAKERWELSQWVRVPPVVKIPVNPLDEHLREVVNPCWNFAGRITTYDGHLQNAVLGLVGEAGEVADIVKKMLYHQPREDGDFTEKLKHELGDVAFYFAKLLEVVGLTLEEVLAANKQKLESRHPELGVVTERFAPGFVGG